MVINLPVRLTITFLLMLLSWPLLAATQEVDPQLREALKQAFAQSSSFEDRFAAEVWLTDMSGRTKRYVSNELERIEILRTVHAEAQRVELPVSLLLGVIHTESRFNRFAVSVVGAQGLMQVMPFWKKEIGRNDDNLTNIQTNLRYGATILKYYLDRSKGNMTEALARYNGSYGKVWYPEKVYRNQRRYED
ncbi:lytic transglycosylase domain-containing protein [Amphritea pacifica]|uniref:Lytic transglycosylase domain-containing protein n=1 Tax=Amphritea pacifica TaxID=2811233 RepID=A0ABS2W4Y2_9GAMM|nr:lytic transglycosylase domain-containing protein [Amphritea pacifica]MBN0986608.1 lytic transglycosylase domain-containing protein [Amphritea pacifica]